jgi:hypothetical protein
MRMHGLAMVAAFSLVTPARGLANPMPEPTWTELAALVPVFAANPSPEQGEKLSTLLRMSPGALVIGTNADVVAENWQVFSPYVLEACRPGVPLYILPAVPEVYLRAADQVHRDAMLEVLRSWLAPSPISSEVSSRYKTVFPVSLDEQITAAEILSDAGDTTAISAMRGLQGRVPPREDAWVQLDEAILRIEHPDASGLLVVVGDSIRVVRPWDKAKVRLMGKVLVYADARESILAALARARTVRSALVGGTVFTVTFSNGARLDFHWLEGTWFSYVDNTRQQVWPVCFTSPELAQALGTLMRDINMDHPLARLPWTQGE